jgi:hypothetical protein
MEVEHEDWLDRIRLKHGLTAEEMTRVVGKVRRELTLDWMNPLVAELLNIAELSGQCTTQWGETVVLEPNLERKAIRELGIRTFDCAVITGGMLDRFIRPLTRWDRKEGKPFPKVEGRDPTHLLVMGRGTGVQTYLLHLDPDDIRPIGD